ncbi:MAG TPA: hypothetical protein VEB64_17245 [Azospirillaceae bacterium]|nr:hypothetical protein [Azospirillaceae bacterium]
MPLSGTGMLVNFMDVDPAEEYDFNRWYDKEHLAERVAIPGFLEARRYVAEEGSAKYLALYTTETFDVLVEPGLPRPSGRSRFRRSRRRWASTCS